ncbi:ABC transporter ATP-binding protein [Treponema pedis]|uniref:ABC transporter ATP-binding protein n=1 Tax=Treponema pedis TaxID=409322 RepID=UPI00041AD41D|nr:ABC transporter ATP-binding protein [Treponema pedis]
MSKSELVLKNISKIFPSRNNKGTTEALHNINLKIESGEFVCIVGPSGCGKSTMLRLVAGLVPITQGEITLNGKKIEGTSINRGMVFQKHALFPWLTLRQNVEFAFKLKGNVKEKKEEVDKFIDMIGMKEFETFYPHQLSGGMAQRVALIRTMITKPEVFLLDEPLGALDAFTRMNIQHELLEMYGTNKNMMFMLVTHDVDEAIYLGTRVIVMAPRPGIIKDDVKIDMDYPRNRNNDKFIEYRKHILEVLEYAG